MKFEGARPDSKLELEVTIGGSRISHTFAKVAKLSWNPNMYVSARRTAMVTLTPHMPAVPANRTNHA